MRGGLGTSTRYKLDILHQCDKGVKTKSQKVCGLIPTFVEVTGKKLAGINTETVHIDCEKGAQNNILANKIVT